MAPMGKTGASDAGIGNTQDPDSMFGEDTGALPQDVNSDALGEPIGVVEVVELESLEPGVTSREAYPERSGTGFRWWYVPAVVVPAAGVTAAVILLQRRQQRRKSAAMAAYRAAAKQSRDWLEAVRSGKATQSAVKALQQGASSVRESARNLPDTAAALRDRSGELVGAAVASAPAQQAAESARGALNSATRLWNSNAPKTRQTAQVRGRGAFRAADARRRGVFMWFAGGSARKAAATAREAARARALEANKAASLAAAKTNRVAQRARKRANRAMGRTRAFIFGALVTAIITYARAWRKRLMERETAGGHA